MVELNNSIKDDDHIEDYQDKIISGTVLYYSTSQVAKILDLTDSKVRYYTTEFKDILNIQVYNKQRRFTKSDIDKLRFLVELKDSGMTIKQIQEYCQEVDFDKEQGIQVREDNPLSIKTMAKALLEEQEKNLANFKVELLSELRDYFIEHSIALEKTNEKFKENLVGVIDEVVTESIEIQFNEKNEELKKDLTNNFNEVLADKLEENNKVLQSFIDQRELEYKKQDEERISMLKAHMEDNKKRSEEEDSKKGFWSRILGK